MSESRPGPAEETTAAAGPAPVDPAPPGEPAGQPPPADDPTEPTEPAEAPPPRSRADPLATGVAVVLMVALLACAAIVLIAAGNA